jgi:hypothetical protein
MNKEKTWKTLTFLGFGSAIVVGVAGLLVVSATRGLIDKANQKIVDLNAKLLQIEDKAKSAEEKVKLNDDKAIEVNDKMSKLDPLIERFMANEKTITDLLVIAEKPDIKVIFSVDHVQRDMGIMARQVADVYQCAQWATDRKLSPQERNSVLRCTMNAFWKAATLKEQQSTGKVVPEWPTGDLYEALKDQGELGSYLETMKK